MKTTICCLLIVLASCTQQPPNNTPATAPVPNNSVVLDTVMVNNPELAKLKIDFGNLSQIDESGIVMSPLTSSNGDDGRFEISSYKSMPGNSYWNIVFYNSNTKEYHLLDERKMLIQTIMDRSGLASAHSKNAIDSNYILYLIKVDDINKDGLLDEKDPSYLFASDRKGKNFRRLSPANQHLNSWTYIEATQKLLMNVTKDSDNNVKFDETDQPHLVEIDLRNEKTIHTVFSDSFQLRLKQLFDRDWKKKKD